MASEQKDPSSGGIKKRKRHGSTIFEQSAALDNNLRKTLYTLIVRQLQDDGLHGVAKHLMQKADVAADLQIENHQLRGIVKEYIVTTGAPTSQASSSSSDDATMDAVKTTLPDAKSSPELPKYITRFVTAHKGAVRCATFSRDGKMVATGSADTSMKVLEVSKMQYHNQIKGDRGEEYRQLRPVIRTYYDHMAAVTDIDFHPHLPWLVSGSEDKTIKLFDTRRKHNKKSSKQIRETHSVRSLHFHPSGDFLLAGTEHSLIRLYDMSTMTAYLSGDVNKAHTSAINTVQWSPDGRVYASCAKDGSIRLWDTVTNTVVWTIAKAHSGADVCSVRFSRDGKWLLSGGRDSVARLWDVGSGKQMMKYEGCFARNYRTQAVWDHSGHNVVWADENSCAAVVWNAWSGKKLEKYSGHHKLVRWIACSPTEPAFVTCSDDHRARFWSASE